MREQQQETKDFQPNYPSPREITRNKLMDAAIRSLQHRGLKSVNIRLIAEESGLSRQTIYKHFKNLPDLLSEAFSREAIELAGRAAHYIEKFDSPREKFVQGFLFIYEEMPKNPILAEVLDPGNDFFNTVGSSRYPYAKFGLLAFGEVFAANPYLSSRAEGISELWIRNVMSFLMMPGPVEPSRAKIEQFIIDFLVPGLGLRE